MHQADLQQFDGQEVEITLSSGAGMTGHYKDNKDGSVSFWIAVPKPKTDKPVMAAGKPVERGSGFKILYETITAVRPAAKA